MAHIEVSRNGHILDIRVNRPEKYNALSLEMFHQLGAAFYELSNDPELRVAVFHAEGKHFTAGIELDQWAPIFAKGERFPVNENEIDPLGLTGMRHTKPVVMAVQGYCFTWGVEILLNTEIRIASSDTQFQMLEVQRGVYPCGGATMRLPEQIGWSNAQRVLLTADRWSAEEALRWGMVQEVVEPGEQYAKALELAEKIADAAPLAVQACLKASRFAQDNDHEARVTQMIGGMRDVLASEDAAEGVRSFVERRKAVFTGR